MQYEIKLQNKSVISSEKKQKFDISPGSSF